MKILVTAGPTQEPIDSVRYITNASSGKTGFAIASEAKKRGYSICLVCGPTAYAPPKKIHVIHVRTSKEMIDETLKELRKGYDVFVCAAAIADYTPKNPVSGKIKSGSELTLKLSPTEKLTRLAREAFPKLFIVGFKAEVNVSEDLLIKYARNKLVAEGLNIIVANDVGKHKFGSDETEVIFLKGSNSYEKRGGSKKDIAKYLLDLIEKSV